MEAIIGEIIGYIVIEGITYLVEKAVDEVGNIIWKALTDEDGDGVPDDPDNPFAIWDEEPEGWLPFLSDDDDDDEKEEVLMPENVLVFTPDGVSVMYPNPEADNFDTIVMVAQEKWAEYYGATVKDFRHYSVSEALLFIIAAVALSWFIGHLFKRRKF